MKHMVKQWYVTLPMGGTLTTNAQNLPGTLVRNLFENPDQPVITGQVRLVRVIGQAQVWVGGLTQGLAQWTVWHGLYHGKNVGQTYQPGMGISQSDGANSEDWLWREPFMGGVNSIVNVLPVATEREAYTAIDWKIRGGKGSNIKIGESAYYVITVEGQAGLTVRFTTKMLALFGGT